jgi:Protein of unknown function (DUF998)
MSTTMERARGLDDACGTGSTRTLAKVLLACGIVASLLYVVANIVGAVVWDGYSLKTFTISELSAVDAPSRPLVPALMLAFGLLSLAFAAGVLLAGRGRGLRVTGWLLVAAGVLNLAGPFVPMHLRGTDTSLTDGMHIAVTAVTSLLLALAIWLGRRAFDRGFRIYSVVTLAVMLGFGTLAAYDGPAIAANDPTPWVGVTERLCIGAYLLWMMALSGALLCAPATPDEHRETTPAAHTSRSARIDGSPLAARSQRSPASSER